jgi:ADP-ribose pyrophosphatase YjhB (NUDIX family)
MEIGRFNVRVYGIFIRNAKVLVTDEFRFGTPMTKFPGGGMEFGEGSIETLIRECKEELGLVPDHIQHFYTTDFFQKTMLMDEPQQLISIYYTMNLPQIDTIRLENKPFEFVRKEGEQAFRFIRLSNLTSDDFTFPIDRKVAEMIIKRYKK